MSPVPNTHALPPSSLTDRQRRHVLKKTFQKARHHQISPCPVQHVPSEQARRAPAEGEKRIARRLGTQPRSACRPVISRPSWPWPCWLADDVMPASHPLPEDGGRRVFPPGYPHSTFKVRMHGVPFLLSCFSSETEIISRSKQA